MDQKRFDLAGIEREITCSSIFEEGERGITIKVLQQFPFWSH